MKTPRINNMGRTGRSAERRRDFTFRSGSYHPPGSAVMCRDEDALCGSCSPPACLLDARADLWFVIHQYSKVADRWTSCEDTAGNWLLGSVFVLCFVFCDSGYGVIDTIIMVITITSTVWTGSCERVPAMAIRRSIDLVDGLRLGNARDGRRLQIGGAESAPLSASCVS